MVEKTVRGLLLMLAGYLLGMYKPVTIKSASNPMKVNIQPVTEMEFEPKVTIEDISIENVTGEYADVYAEMSDGTRCKVKFLNKAFDDREHVIGNVLDVLEMKCLRGH